MRGLWILRERRYPVFCLLLLLISSLMGTAQAATIDCKAEYTVASGDSLSVIAEQAYGSAAKYNLIYYANKSNLPAGPSVIRVGQKLRIPCADANEAAAEATTEVTADATAAVPVTATDTTTASTGEPVAAPVPEPAVTSTSTSAAPVNEPVATPDVTIHLLTAGDYKPFTDKSLPGGGLITELVEATLKNQQVSYDLTWIEDWSSHLDPLLKEKKYDMGFPWLNPGCPGADNFRCEFLFSKPIFEMLELLFTRADKPLVFEKDEDMPGHTLCRPAGYFTHDLDSPERQWLKKKLIKLEQPQSVKACFEMLMNGEVDAVAMNDFTGRETLASMDLTDKVIALPRELSIGGLHVLVHKTHPRATIMINAINNGLAAIQKTGEYDAIMDKQLLNHWKTVEALQKK